MHPVNTLYYGDNLEVLRKHIGDETVDLIYLDPPFNSNRDYNLLFKEQSGEPAQAQIKAFTDTWRWSERAFHEFIEECPRPALVELLQGFVRTLGRNDLTAYLVMMAPRLIELHRVLKPTGSLYLHCDPTASHYLKVMLDVIFGAKNFRNEIVWKRTGAHSGAKRWGPVHDIILFYTKTQTYTWNRIYAEYESGYLESSFRYIDERGRYRLQELTGAGVTAGDSGQEWRGVNPSTFGRHWAVPQKLVESLVGVERARQMSVIEKLEVLDAAGFIVWTERGRIPRYKQYLDTNPGVPIQDVVSDIRPVGAQKERLGYPTQKPLALLERIIQASSNEGDLVLDPFCGCGTAIVAAHKLNRRWIGIDITHLAIALIKYRLSDMFDLKEGKDYRVIGEPTTVAEARALALQDRDEFQKWAIGLIPRAFPYQQKKGADTGIDGMLYFTDNPREHPKKVVIQVKSGRVGVKDIRDFRGVMEREKAVLGLFITLEPPTRDMVREAEQAGFYTTPLGNIRLQRLQIRTIEDLLQGRGFDIPSAALLSGVQTAERVQPESHQPELEM
ncbi:MAG: DNA methyltransferase [Fimbriimonadales bacterium]|nr:DNA methyltransferase [Fimbriimonadales bacterium]